MTQKNKLRKQLTKNIVDIGQALVSLSVASKVLDVADVFAGTKVGEGNIIRIEITADTYVAFSDEAGISIPTVATTPAVKLIGAGMHYVVCQCDYIRTSIAITRAELLEL